MPANDQTIKADAGKLQMRLLVDGMPLTLKLLGAVLTYGAQKYDAHSWRNVDTERYADAKIRHQLEAARHGGLSVDEESGLPHEAHEIVNAMFILEQQLAKLTPKQFSALLKFKAPPQEHKTQLPAVFAAFKPGDYWNVQMLAGWEATGIRFNQGEYYNATVSSVNTTGAGEVLWWDVHGVHVPGTAVKPIRRAPRK